jgi:hypothetical protein
MKRSLDYVKGYFVVAASSRVGLKNHRRLQKDVATALLAIRRRKGESFSRTLRYREVFLCART